MLQGRAGEEGGSLLPQLPSRCVCGCPRQGPTVKSQHFLFRNNTGYPANTEVLPGAQLGGKHRLELTHATYQLLVPTAPRRLVFTSPPYTYIYTHPAQVTPAPALVGQELSLLGSIWRSVLQADVLQPLWGEKCPSAGQQGLCSHCLWHVPCSLTWPAPVRMGCSLECVPDPGHRRKRNCSEPHLGLVRDCFSPPLTPVKSQHFTAPDGTP